MSKKKFSSSVINSLNGRNNEILHSKNTEINPNSSNLTSATKEELPAPISASKKSSVGRPALKESEKKKQIVLTIKPETMKALAACDPDFKKLLSRYIDKNIGSIVEALKSL